MKEFIFGILSIQSQQRLIWCRNKLSIKSILNIFFRILPIQNNKIVISSLSGAGYGDNPKYITEYLLNKEGLDLVWLVKPCSAGTVPPKVRTVSYDSIRAVYELTTARAWVDNVRKPLWLSKRKRQYYLNTGHGGVPLKKVEADVPEEVLGAWYVATAKHDSKMCDLMISNCSLKTRICKQSYWYNGEVQPWGSPKIEAIKNSDSELFKKVAQHYNLAGNVKLALYAPTFRNDEQGIHILMKDYASLRETLKKKFGGNWIIMVRLHPNWAHLQNMIDENQAVNATEYPDMQELLSACDVLITDYSGTMFETLFVDKKVFLYVPDKDSYEREFYYSFEELPFPNFLTEDELLRGIMEFDEDYYKQRVEKFKIDQGFVYGGDTARKCGDRILTVIQGEN